MKLIHTADWHLGKRLGGFLLAEEQRESLGRILDLVDRERPDAVVVAGDVFDTPVPPLSALECWEWFVANLVGDREVPLIVIPGNHDHPERLGINASVTRMSGLYILNDLATAHVPVTIAGVELFGVPFHKPAHVRAMLAREAAVTPRSHPEAGDGGQDEASGAKAPSLAASGMEASGVVVSGMEASGLEASGPEASGPEASDDDYDAAMGRMLARVRAARSDSVPAVLVAHAFIDGSGEEPDGEDAILVGGAGGVHLDTLRGFEYVALGHIHSARNCDASGCVRYSGSIYPYAFDDSAMSKTVDVVTLEDGEVSVRREPIEVRRWVRVIDAKSFAQILNEAEHAPATRRDDYLMIRVTDTGPIEHALARLREYYPNALLQQPAIEAQATAVRFDGDARSIGVEEAFRAFYEHVYGEAISGMEETLLREILAEDTPQTGDLG